ncbi:MAG: DoxX family protein [Acidobacteriota bacterium]
MPISPTIRILARRGLAALDSMAFLPPLATRIVIGLGFLQTGLGKWQHFDRTVSFFAGLGIPMPTANAAVVATLEVVGGGALVVGLMTRLFAAGLSTTMVVALLTADRDAFLSSWGWASATSPTDVVSFVFLLFLLWLVFLGPGTLSVDRWLRRLVLGAVPAGTPPPASPAADGARVDEAVRR